MGYLDVFKCSLNSALDRNYFLDRWINDHSWVILLRQNYQLDKMKVMLINTYVHTNIDDI